MYSNLEKLDNIINNLEVGECKSIDFIVSSNELDYLISNGCIVEGEIKRVIRRYAPKPETLTLAK